MNAQNSPATPKEIRVSKDKRNLIVSFEKGEAYTLEAELLRVRSPSAEVQGHSPEQRVLVHGKRNVEIMSVEPIGNYAIKIGFDDMHDTGIFMWSFLAELGEHKKERWAEYEQELSDAGKTRDPFIVK
ncbi:MAG: gamma-butyrobetaine hydroxylase-like domain-containing protein [Nitratireductor sp.]